MTNVTMASIWLISYRNPSSYTPKSCTRTGRSSIHIETITKTRLHCCTSLVQRHVGCCTQDRQLKWVRALLRCTGNSMSNLNAKIFNHIQLCINGSPRNSFSSRQVNKWSLCNKMFRIYVANFVSLSAQSVGHFLTIHLLRFLVSCATKISENSHSFLFTIGMKRPLDVANDVVRLRSSKDSASKAIASTKDTFQPVVSFQTCYTIGSLLKAFFVSTHASIVRYLDTNHT